MLSQLLYANVAVCLFGEAVPAQLGQLNLRQKAILYCLLVESWDWDSTRTIIGRRSWKIRTAITDATHIMEGVYVQA